MPENTTSEIIKLRSHAPVEQEPLIPVEGEKQQATETENPFEETTSFQMYQLLLEGTLPPSAVPLYFQKQKQEDLDRATGAIYKRSHPINSVERRFWKEITVEHAKTLAENYNDPQKIAQEVAAIEAKYNGLITNRQEQARYFANKAMELSLSPNWKTAEDTTRANTWAANLYGMASQLAREVVVEQAIAEEKAVAVRTAPKSESNYQGHTEKKTSTETLHLPIYDLILNLTVDDPAKVRELAEQFEDGIPDHWSRYTTGHPMFTRTYEVYTDSQDEPRYIAKVRRLARAEDIRKARQLTDPKAWVRHFGDIDRPMLNAVNSLLNEIKMTPAINDVLDCEEVKQLVAAYRFQDIRYAEPLLGVINRQTGQKTMVYDFINGYNLGKQALIDEEHGQYGKYNYDVMVKRLKDIFARHGIEASDLMVPQFLVQDANGQKKLYLLDTEKYVRENNNTPSTIATHSLANVA